MTLGPSHVCWIGNTVEGMSVYGKIKQCVFLCLSQCGMQFVGKHEGFHAVKAGQSNRDAPCLVTQFIPLLCHTLPAPLTAHL